MIESSRNTAASSINCQINLGMNSMSVSSVDPVRVRGSNKGHLRPCNLGIKHSIMSHIPPTHKMENNYLYSFKDEIRKHTHMAKFQFYFTLQNMQWYNINPFIDMVHPYNST